MAVAIATVIGADAEQEIYLKEYVANLIENIKEYSDGESLIRILSTFPKLITKFKQTQAAANTMKTIEEVILSVRSNNFNYEEIMNKVKNIAPAREFLKANCSGNALSKETSSKFIEEMLKIEYDTAATVVKAGAVVSIVFLALEIANLFLIYQDISKARNIVEESKESIYIIEKEIAALTEQVNELTVLHIEFEQLEEDKKLEAAVDIKLKTSAMFNDCGVTLDRISNVKMQIDGQIVTLADQKRKLVIGGIGNVFQGIMVVLQFALMPIKSAALLAIQGAVFVVHALTASVQVTFYVVTKKRLEELRECLKMLSDIDTKMNAINESIKRAQKWIEANCKSRRKNRNK